MTPRRYSSSGGDARLMRSPSVLSSKIRLPALAVLVLVAMACQTVPVTGRRELLLLPESSEREMGLTSYEDVLKKSKVSNDPRLNEQVTRVGRRIAEATGRTDYQWDFKVIEENQANAFCLPGGKVAVYTGMFPLTRDDAGLAAVLGHEVAHAVARHGGERLTQTLLIQTGLAATQVALANHDPVVVQSVTALLGAGASVGLLLPWGRAQESEADHVGLVYMARAGYHPSAARDLWLRMQEAAKGQQGPPAFLSTHPSYKTRITQIEGWMPEALAEYKPR
jgi:metalloendopeptidase OMA1, mitochondrial